MNMKKSLAGLMAGIVAVSAMATSAFAADEPFSVALGAKSVDTAYTYTFEATGAYAIPLDANVDFTVTMPIPTNGWGWSNNGDWNMVTITVEGMTADQKNTTSATYSIDNKSIKNVGNVFTYKIATTSSLYGTGLKLGNFDKQGNAAIVTKITISNVSNVMHDVTAAIDSDAVKATLGSTQVMAFLPSGASGGSLGDPISVEAKPTKMEDKSSTAVAANAEATVSLKNSQKRIIREGATATLTFTFDADNDKVRTLTYKIGENEYVVIVNKGETTKTVAVAASDLYKAAASEDDDETYLGKFTNTSEIYLSSVVLNVTPAAGSDEDSSNEDSSTEDSSSEDSSDGDSSTDGDTNPPTGSAPAALALIPVALAAAVVVAKKRA